MCWQVYQKGVQKILAKSHGSCRKQSIDSRGSREFQACVKHRNENAEFGSDHDYLISKQLLLITVKRKTVLLWHNMYVAVCQERCLQFIIVPTCRENGQKVPLMISGS